ncbi:MAG: DUF2141 domain-containing protein [Polyangiales bacterium]
MTRLQRTQTVLGSSIALACLAAAPSTVQAGAPNARIEVEVPRTRSSKGSLRCALFATHRGFPSRSSLAVQAHKRPIASQRGRCVFRGVKPGTYAVSVLHDENDNGRIDTSFIGKPTEGYGVSYNHTYALRGPKWNESKFSVGPGATMKLRVRLRY